MIQLLFDGSLDTIHSFIHSFIHSLASPSTDGDAYVLQRIIRRRRRRSDYIC